MDKSRQRRSCTGALATELDTLLTTPPELQEVVRCTLIVLRLQLMWLGQPAELRRKQWFGQGSGRACASSSAVLTAAKQHSSRPSPISPSLSSCFFSSAA